MYNRKKGSLRTEPWGTPEVTFCEDDLKPFTKTDCEQFAKKALNPWERFTYDALVF